MRLRTALLASLALALLAGCLPSRFVIDLDARSKLREVEVFEDEGGAFRSAKIAQIDVQGLISHVPAGGIFAGTVSSVDALVARLEKAKQDSSVRAVILRINSPGGSVAASETMYREVERFRVESGKPVVVSMGEVAASGGYYVALAADRILAQPASITGSIGVLIQTINVSQGLGRLGIMARAVTSGSNKDLTNPLEPVREEHFEIVQGVVDEFYESFRQRVVTRRTSLPAERIDEITDGRIFTGSTAAELGLIDATGGLREAFAQAKALAGVTHARLVKYTDTGREPASPYAVAAAPAGAPTAPHVSLRVSLPQLAALEPGFYYLWSPGW